MFEFLKHVLSGQNQFASGGLLLMVIGSVGAFLRGVPEQLWLWLVQQTTMMITVSDDDDSFVWVKEWFLEQKFLKRIRSVDLDTLGNMSRTSGYLRNPGLKNLDVSISKQFTVTERVMTELRGEAFNAFNTPAFSGPNTSVSGGHQLSRTL
jgi:hypothetical protein